MSARQLCTFHLGSLFLGVDVACVQEVIRSQRMTRVPLAAPMVRGLINLRGRIVTAIDMRRRMGVPDREPGHDPMNVVVHVDDGVVSLMVDEIGDVVTLGDDLIDVPPSTMPAATRELIRAVYKTSPKLLLVLDVERAVRTGMGARAWAS